MAPAKGAQVKQADDFGRSESVSWRCASTAREKCLCLILGIKPRQETVEAAIQRSIWIVGKDRCDELLSCWRRQNPGCKVSADHPGRLLNPHRRAMPS